MSLLRKINKMVCKQTEQIKFEWCSADQLNWLKGKKEISLLEELFVNDPSEWQLNWILKKLVDTYTL